MTTNQVVKELGLKKLKNWVAGVASAALVGLMSYFGIQFLDHGERNFNIITKNADKFNKMNVGMEKLTLALDNNTKIQELKINHMDNRINDLEDDFKAIDKKLDKIEDKL